MFAERIIISDELTFHLNDKMNRFLCLGTKNLHQVIEHQHDSLKVNFFYAVLREEVQGRRVTGMTCFIILID